jgi:hypothetical protein
MRIQLAHGADLEYTRSTMGELNKIVIEYVKSYQFMYIGHFILTIKG